MSQGETVVARLRFSIASLMAVVLCVAVNIAALRWLLSLPPVWLAGLLLTVPLLEVGVWRLVRRNGRARAFWAGFVACGMAATSTFAWAMLTIPTIGLNGKTRVYFVEYPGSWIWSVWENYASHTSRALGPLLESVGVYPGMPIVPWVLGVLLWSLPQCAAALGGGILAQGLFAWRCKAASSRESDGQALASSACAK
jgi:hypothetical protein